MDALVRTAYWICYVPVIYDSNISGEGFSVLPAWNFAATLFGAFLPNERRINLETCLKMDLLYSILYH